MADHGATGPKHDELAIPGVSAEAPVEHAPDASPDTSLAEQVANHTVADTTEGAKPAEAKPAESHESGAAASAAGLDAKLTSEQLQQSTGGSLTAEVMANGAGTGARSKTAPTTEAPHTGNKDSDAEVTVSHEHAAIGDHEERPEHASEEDHKAQHEPAAKEDHTARHEPATKEDQKESHATKGDQKERHEAAAKGDHEGRHEPAAKGGHDERHEPATKGDHQERQEHAADGGHEERHVKDTDAAIPALHGNVAPGVDNSAFTGKTDAAALHKPATDAALSGVKEAVKGAVHGHGNGHDEHAHASRKYLEDTVVPVLRDALRHLVVDRPADPYDYLAQYILNHKPHA
jgi:hypothetical protein